MLKTLKYTAALCAFAGACLLAVPAVSSADSVQATQKGQTVKGDKSTPKKEATHAHGTVTASKSVGLHLKAPELRESGMGKLQGVEIKGNQSTPKRAPTHGATPKGN